MVTIVSSVPPQDNTSLNPSDLHRFTLETSMFNTSNAPLAQFSVTCFLENTKRWQRVKTPPPGAFLSVTAKVAGRTTDTNRLALRVVDLAYLPRPASATATAAPTPTATPPSKRSNRWEGRAGLSTPSKRTHILEPANEPANPPNRDTTLLDMA